MNSSKKEWCYCSKCGQKEIATVGDPCFYCGTWSEMLSLKEIELSLLKKSDGPLFLPAPLQRPRIPDTVKELIDLWLKIKK